MTAVRKGADFFLFQLMLLLCAIWGSQQVAIKLAADDIAPMLQVALRSGVAAVLVGLQKTDEGPTHGARIHLHRIQRGQPGAEETGDTEQQGMSQVDTIALMITPDRQHHVRHHHHQRSPLSKLLIQAENDAQHRNGDQPAADAEQTTQRPQAQPQ